MATIATDADVLTLINTFDVDPDNTAALVTLLETATIDVMQHIDGFVSASIHRSLDGKTVTNYAQWRDKPAFDAMLRDDEARVHMKRAEGLIKSYSPVLCHVTSTHG